MSVSLASKNIKEKRKIAFDLYRAIAVLLVVLGHFVAEQSLPIVVKKIVFAFAAYGVPLFFIISGFLLTASLQALLQKYPRQLCVSIWQFLIKRCLRIYPAYIVSLVILVICHPVPVMDFVMHFFNIHNFNSDFSRSINGVYWTLAVEFQWYFIAPWLILYLLAVQWHIAIIFFSLVCGMSFLLRSYFIDEYMQQLINAKTLVFLAQDQLCVHLFNFLLGILLYKFKSYRVNLYRIEVCFLLFLLIFIGYVQSNMSSHLTNYREGWVLLELGLGYIAIIILTVIMSYFMFIEVNKTCSRMIVFIATISYSLYIYHLPLLIFWGSYDLLWYELLPLYIISSIACATISYYVIELPFLRYSAR